MCSPYQSVIFWSAIVIDEMSGPAQWSNCRRIGLLDRCRPMSLLQKHCVVVLCWTRGLGSA